MGSQMGTPTVSRLYCTIPVFVKGTNLHRFGEDFFFFFTIFWAGYSVLILAMSVALLFSSAG